MYISLYQYGVLLGPLSTRAHAANMKTAAPRRVASVEQCASCINHRDVIDWEVKKSAYFTLILLINGCTVSNSRTSTAAKSGSVRYQPNHSSDQRHRTIHYGDSARSSEEKVRLATGNDVGVSKPHPSTRPLRIPVSGSLRIHHRFVNCIVTPPSLNLSSPSRCVSPLLPIAP